MTGTTKPNFVIAGAARSGTTALARTLAQHPEVFFTDPKEVHFFAHVGHPVTYTGPGDDQMINASMITDPARYHALFDGAADRPARGEGSVSTLYHAERSVAAINTWADPDTRVILVLREPAARAYSAYLYLRGRGFEPLDAFDAALAEEDDRIARGYHHMWHYRAMSRYSSQLPLFIENFGARLLVLIQEEYLADPDDHLRRVAGFLGIDPHHHYRTGPPVNRGGEPRSRLLANAMSALRASEPVKAAVKRVTPERLRERVRAANLHIPDDLPASFGALHAEFAADRRVVQDHLARPIPSWTLR